MSFNTPLETTIRPMATGSKKNGVVPDEVVVPTKEQLESGLDIPLQKASDWILSQ